MLHRACPGRAHGGGAVLCAPVLQILSLRVHRHADEATCCSRAVLFVSLYVSLRGSLGSATSWCEFKQVCEHWAGGTGTLARNSNTMYTRLFNTPSELIILPPRPPGLQLRQTLAVWCDLFEPGAPGAKFWARRAGNLENLQEVLLNQA